MYASHTLIDDGAPQHAREITLSWMEGPDAPEDRISLTIGAPGPGQPEQTYDVYRNGWGWDVLYRALDGDPAKLRAAADWWQAQHDTMPYAGYRLLTAIEGHGRATSTQLEESLQLAPHALDGCGLYPRTVDALLERRLIGVHPDGWCAVTRSAESVLRPASPARAADEHRWFATVLESSHAAHQLRTARAAGRQPPTGGGRAHPAAAAFPTPPRPDAATTAGTGWQRAPMIPVAAPTPSRGR